MELPIEFRLVNINLKKLLMIGSEIKQWNNMKNIF